MSSPKTGTSKTSKQMHYSVGAIIKINGKYLLIDRKNAPLGFAGLAGHVDEGEDEIQALVREVAEESGLKVEGYNLLFQEELDWNWCSKGAGTHFWFLYECEVSGRLKDKIPEAKSIGWHSPEEIGKMKLEPVWEYWFKKLALV